MLEEVFQSDAHLFINTATGRRFVRKDLPLLRRYFVVAADGGSIVLVERASPHAACVLNPFTGSLVRFLAPMPIVERDVVCCLCDRLVTADARPALRQIWYDLLG
nr:unnamed protein product [Digitaria exilis]